LFGEGAVRQRASFLVESRETGGSLSLWKIVVGNRDTDARRSVTNYFNTFVQSLRGKGGSKMFKRSLSVLMAVLMIAAVTTVSAFASAANPQYTQTNYFYYTDSDGVYGPSPHGQDVISGYDVTPVYDVDEDGNPVLVSYSATIYFKQGVVSPAPNVNIPVVIDDFSTSAYTSIFDDTTTPTYAVIYNVPATGGLTTPVHLNFAYAYNGNTVHPGGYDFDLVLTY
jgi:hypothetical protein